MMKRLLILGSLFAPLSALAASPAFVPLTDIPNLTGGSNTADIGAFLNNLYDICIGIVVVLAVLQLIRAGIEYMTAAGNVGSTEKAKDLIWKSILGVVLVLSPYIVFSLINPAILNFNIGNDVNALQLQQRRLDASLNTPGAGGTEQDLEDEAARDAAARASATPLFTTQDKTFADANCTPAKTGYLPGVGGVAGPHGGTPVFEAYDVAYNNYTCYQNKGAVIDPSTCSSATSRVTKAECDAVQQKSAVAQLDPLTCNLNDSKTGKDCLALKTQVANTCQVSNQNCRTVQRQACEGSGDVYTEKQDASGTWTTLCKAK